MAASSPIAAMMVMTTHLLETGWKECRKSGRHTDIGALLLISTNLVAKFTLGNLDIVLLAAIRFDQVKVVVINVGLLSVSYSCLFIISREVSLTN